MNNLISMLSMLVREGILTNFTYLWLESLTLKSQTFRTKSSGKDRDGNTTITSINDSLQNLLSNIPKRVTRETYFEPMSMVTIQ